MTDMDEVMAAVDAYAAVSAWGAPDERKAVEQAVVRYGEARTERLSALLEEACEWLPMEVEREDFTAEAQSKLHDLEDRIGRALHPEWYALAGEQEPARSDGGMEGRWREWPEYKRIDGVLAPLVGSAALDALCERVEREEAIGNSADFQMVIRHCSQVYDEVTRGRISKPNTLPSEVIGVMEELHEQDIEEAVQAERARADRLAAVLRETVNGIAAEHPQCDITNTMRCYCGRVTAAARAALADSPKEEAEA